MVVNWPNTDIKWYLVGTSTSKVDQIFTSVYRRITVTKLTVKNAPKIEEEMNYGFFRVINLLKSDVYMTPVNGRMIKGQILTKYQRQNSVNYLPSKLVWQKCKYKCFISHRSKFSCLWLLTYKANIKGGNYLCNHCIVCLSLY